MAALIFLLTVLWLGSMVIIYILHKNGARDRFASAALAALLSHEKNVVATQDKDSKSSLAKDAFAYADAMMKEWG